MMAEMPPSSASNGAYPAGPGFSAPAARATGGIGFNRRYFTSIGGIATIVAWGCALIAMIAYEAAAPRNITYSPLVFHEFSVVTSWVFLTIFIALAGFNVHTLMGLAEPTMNFIVIGHSGLWGFFVFISSCVVAGAGWGAWSGIAASIAFGFFEAFALFGVVGVTVMHVMNKFHAPSFD